MASVELLSANRYKSSREYTPWAALKNSKTIILGIWMILKESAFPRLEPTEKDLAKKIAALEKQLQWERLDTDAVNTMNDIAEYKLKLLSENNWYRLTSPG